MPEQPPTKERPRDLDPWHMRRALELAALGRGLVEPNPMVGCVIARGAEIIGEGYHARYGGPHAEINALAVAGDRATGAAMYVTLEPCCHHGKTPPCTQAILAAGIREVVVAQEDPFAQVAGGGIAELLRRGSRRHGRRTRGRSRTLECAVFETGPARPPLGDREMGHDARRTHGHVRRHEPLDIE